MNTIKSQYNYAELLVWLEQKGKDLYGPNFRIHDRDHVVLYRLMAYFLKDTEAASHFTIDLNKGILLAGPVGSGKTSLMNIMRYLAQVDQKFVVKPCREISFEFINAGYAVIQKYGGGTRQSAGHSVSAQYCFDDLGVENNLKYFGNDCNVMAEVLLSRYDVFINKKIPTHITTNLSASEIEHAYGLRVRSRLREMMNLVAFDQDTPDKR